MKIDNYRLDMAVDHSRHSRNFEQKQFISSATGHTENQQGIQFSDSISVVETQYTYTAREIAANRNRQLSSSNITSLNSNSYSLRHESNIESLISDFVGQNVLLTSFTLESENTALNTRDQSLSLNQDAVQGKSRTNSFGEREGLPMGQFFMSSHFIEYEQETMSFQAQGEVTLADGRTINFDLALSMDRSYFKQEQLNISNTTSPLVYDPLVLDLAGNGPSFSKVKFDFDIDNDGDKENLAFIGQGSGFLVLDKNQDGDINNGSEMFGGVSGQGFKELAVHDDDGNMWIDENDAVFEQLQIWHLNDRGEKQLTSLKDAGVGAIYLGSNDNNFTLKDEHNNALGTIQKSGVFLKENGEVSSISQFDLADQRNLIQGLETKLDAVTSEAKTIKQQETLEAFVSWFGSEDSLGQIDALIEKVENQEFSLAQFREAQKNAQSIEESENSPMLEFLQTQTLTAQNNLAELRKKFDSEDSEIDMRFSHLSQLVDMLSALEED